MNKLSILRTSCLLDRPERAHSDTKKEFERFLTWVLTNSPYVLIVDENKP